MPDFTQIEKDALQGEFEGANPRGLSADVKAALESAHEKIAAEAEALVKAAEKAQKEAAKAEKKAEKAEAFGRTEG